MMYLLLIVGFGVIGFAILAAALEVSDRERRQLRADVDRILRTLYDLEDQVRDQAGNVAELRALAAIAAGRPGAEDLEPSTFGTPLRDKSFSSAAGIFGRSDRLPEGGDA